jgi:uncharacterized membrane-anchored protein
VKGDILISGIARINNRTKELTKTIKSSEIAVIDHDDIDEVSAKALVACRIKCVLNAAPSITGKYPNHGPLHMVENGILLIDNCGAELFEKISEGVSVGVDEITGEISQNGLVLLKGQPQNAESLRQKMLLANENVAAELDRFVVNTLEFARNEIGLITDDLSMPEIDTNFNDRHTLIVVRGKYYKEDLQAISSYIKEQRPVLVGVDGGADALLEVGFVPDIIVGDMDSVSDNALSCGAELVVHAYRNGAAPGLERVQRQGLTAKIFASAGTSEDIAMLMAYEHQAKLIVAVGTHSNMIDFLEKGRKGMASTFLVRLKVGSILVDARGVAELQKMRFKKRYFVALFFAAFIPLTMVIALSPVFMPMLRLLLIKMQIILGI